MAQAALIANIAGSAFGALGTMQAAKAEKAQAERNAYIARTRAVQTDVAAREGLAGELATMRATLAANGQRGGAETLFDALVAARGRERRVEFGNRMLEASDWRMQGRNAMAKGRSGALAQMFGGAQSMFDLYQLRKRGG